MGLVYEVYDRDRGMRVALKTLRHVDAMGLYFFKREFRALSDLSHPNIIALYELLSEGDDWFLTMEVVDGVDFIEYVRGGRVPGKQTSVMSETLCEGSDLHEDDDFETMVTRSSVMPGDLGPAIAQHEIGLPAPEGRPLLDDMVDLGRLRSALGQLAGALHVLHTAGLIHRDLKPSNVRITQQHRVVLMDFGIVAEMRAQRSRAIDDVTVGTPAFMAPEQILNVRPTAAADWYAFGVMMYLALTGRLPYRGTRSQVLQAKQRFDAVPPSVYVRGIPEDLERLCADLMARDACRRPDSAEVLERLGMGHPAARRTAGRGTGTPFVGRARELRALQDIYAEVRDGAAACVVVEGPSGMGKTSLLERFAEELMTGVAGAAMASGVLCAADRPLFLAGRCHERESLVYKAFDGVIDSLSLHLAEMPAARRRAFLPADAITLTRLFPVLCRVPECSGTVSLDGHMPAQLRARAMSALRALLAALARERPVIVRIEDIQWADRDSMELLVELLRSPAPPRLLVLATMRTERSRASELTPSHDNIAALAGLESCRRLRLGPLSEDEQRQLLARLASQHALGEHIDDPMWRESAGHPMLLAELARYAEEAPEELGPVRQLHLEDVIWRRIGFLPEPARFLVQTIAVAAEPLPLRVLADASSLSSIDRERAAAALCAAHLARSVRTDEREPWLDSYHDKVREAICDRLLAEQLRAVHDQLAHALESWGGAPPATMARHWLAAGDRVRASRYLLEAASRAADQLALERAAELYRRVLELLGDDTRGRALERMRCQAWIGLAKGMRLVDGNNEAIWDLLDRAQQAADVQELVEELATIHYLRGSLLFPRGDLAGCLAEHEKARHFAQKARSADGEARALSGLGDAYLLHGRLLRAHDHYDSCIELCRRHGFDDIEAANLSMRGMTRFFRNELADGLEDCLRASRAAARVGSHRSELIARSGGMIWILHEMGRLDEAEREIERALELARQLGNQRFEAHALANMGRNMALRGERAGALAALEQAIELSRDHGFALTAPLALGMIALISDDAGARRRALEQGESVLTGGIGSPSYMLFCRDAMDASLRIGDIEGAEHHARRLEEYTRPEPLPWSRFFVARTRVLSVHARGTRSDDIRAALSRLHDEGSAAGLAMAVRALREALEDHTW